MVPSIALAAYMEPLIDGRRVVVFGTSTHELSEVLLERGARVVHVFDEDSGRAAEAAARNRSRNISVAPLGESDVAVRDGAFDVALVENLAAASDVPRLLKRVRRSLSTRGAALICSPNPDVDKRLVSGFAEDRRSDPLGYYDLYDAVTNEFSIVRMLGQTPFVGYAIVDFAPEEEPEVTVDSASVPGGGEEPEWFIALASSRELQLDPFAVIQLPVSGVVGERHDETARHELAKAGRELEEIGARLARAEAENERLRQDAASAKQAPPPDDRIAPLQRQLEERDGWIRQLEARASAADARADEALEALEEQRERLQRARLLEKRLVETEHERDELLRDLDTMREKLEQLSRVSQDEDRQSDDYAALEKALVDRAHYIDELERKLEQTERVGAGLVQELDELRAGRGAVAEGDMENLAARNAELEADLVASRWTIEELEQRLEAAGGQQDLEERLERAQADLQAKQALLEQYRARAGSDASDPR